MPTTSKASRSLIGCRWKMCESAKMCNAACTLVPIAKDVSQFAAKQESIYSIDCWRKT
jgi:hypothetical protein